MSVAVARLDHRPTQAPPASVPLENFSPAYPLDRRLTASRAPALSAHHPPGRHVKWFKARQRLYQQGEPVQTHLQVIEGVVATYLNLADGRRQIAALCLAGDWVNPEDSQHHHLNAEALTRCQLRLQPTFRGSQPFELDTLTGLPWGQCSAQQLKRHQDHIALLRNPCITSRLALTLRFLVGQDGQFPDPDQSVLIPIRRQHIADYIGVSVETVSRTFTELCRSGIIELVTPCRLRCLDTRTLNALTSGNLGH